MTDVHPATPMGSPPPLDQGDPFIIRMAAVNSLRAANDKLAAVTAEAARYKAERDDFGNAARTYFDGMTTACEQRDEARAVAAEMLAEVELGTLGQHTAAATRRTLARTAEWRKRAGLEPQP